jgi:DNA transformation protein
MPSTPAASRLEDLPNIGASIARDLRAIGIASPAALRRKKPRQVFHDLEKTMGPRHDPCVFYTLLSVQHFFETAEPLPWWRFTAEGQAQLAQQRPGRKP